MDWRLTLDWRDRNVASTRAFICLGVSQTRVSPAARTHSTSDFASTHAKNSMNHDSFHEMCTATGVGGHRNLVYFILDRQRVCAKLPNSETHGHAICSKIARRPHSAGPQGGLVELQGAARGERVRLHVQGVVCPRPSSRNGSLVHLCFNAPEGCWHTHKWDGLHLCVFTEHCR